MCCHGLDPGVIVFVCVVDAGAGAGAVGVLVVNNGLPANVSFSLKDLGGEIEKGVRVRDVWRRKDGGEIAAGGEYTVELGVHASSLLVLDPLLQNPS